MPAPPLKLNFADSQYIYGYKCLFATAGRIDMDNGLNLTRADYKSGYCIFVFDTSPSFCHGEPQERKKNETFRANIEFRASLLNSINVIMYMEFDNNIFVEKKTDHERLLKIDSNHLRCTFDKDLYTREIFQGVFAKDQFMKEYFEKET